MAVEAFAFQASETSPVKLGSYFEYLDELSKEIYAPKNRRTQKLSEEAVKPSYEQTVKELDLDLVPERMFEEVVNSLSSQKNPIADSLDKDLADSLLNVEKRLKIYR